MDSTPHSLPEDDREIHAVDLEDLFTRYRSSGRPGLLSEVFRHTAPELLSVALHLTRDAARAEDLVQCTFVEAIGSARSYTPGRRVLPWLMGILSNVARRERRRHQLLDLDRVPVPKAFADPFEAACGTEIHEAVERGLVALDEPYRNVLQLHLTEGLTSPEIALRVSRSPATVRSQIARGLGLLQQRLPQRLALGAALGFSPRRGLEAVEAEVMSRAWRSAPGLAARGGFAHVAGLLARRSTLVAVGCAGGLAAAVYVSGGVPERASRTLSRPPSERSAHATNTLAQDAQRGQRTAASLTLDQSAIDRGRLAVQVAHHGRGLEGVNVRVQRLGDREGRFVERCGMTDSQGALTLDDLATGSWHLELDRARGGSFQMRAGETTELNLDLSDGWDVTGTVVDTRGIPVEGAQLWWSDFGHPDSGMVSGRTDARGDFSMAGVDPDYCVAALHAEFAPSALAALHGSSRRSLAPSLSERLPRGPIVLNLGPEGASIHGRVVGEDGTPIENALVRYGRSSQPFQVIDSQGGPSAGVCQPPGVETRTDESGEYRLAAGGLGDRKLFVRARGFDGLRTMVPAQGAGDVRRDTVLSTGTVVEGRFTDGAVPLRNAHVTAEAAGAGAPGWFSPRATTGEDGSFRLTGVAKGPVALLIQWGAKREARIVLEPGGSAPRTLTADVSSLASEDPDLVVADAWISVRAHASDGLALKGLTARTRRHGSGVWEEWASTDTTLRLGPLAPGQYRVVVLADGHVPWVWEAATLASQSSVDLGNVDLERGGRLVLATLQGRPEEGAEHPKRLSVRIFDEGGRLLYHGLLEGPDDRLPPLPAGRIRVSAWGHGRPLMLTTCDIREGETTRLVLRDPPCVHQVVNVVPPTASASLAARDMTVTWFNDGLAVATESMAFGPGEALRFRQVLAPGEYSVRVEMRTATSTASVIVGGTSPEPLTLVLKSND